jgi:hypothetical protein
MKNAKDVATLKMYILAGVLAISAIFSFVNAWLNYFP